MVKDIKWDFIKCRPFAPLNVTASPPRDREVDGCGKASALSELHLLSFSTKSSCIDNFRFFILANSAAASEPDGQTSVLARVSRLGSKKKATRRNLTGCGDSSAFYYLHRVFGSERGIPSQKKPSFASPSPRRSYLEGCDYAGDSWKP